MWQVRKLTFFLILEPLILSLTLTLDLSPLAQLLLWGGEGKSCFIQPMSPVNLKANFYTFFPNYSAMSYTVARMRRLGQIRGHFEVSGGPS